MGTSERIKFIRMTYLHLLGAILLFTGLEYLLFKNDAIVEAVTVPLLKFVFADSGRGGGAGYNWLIVLGLFMAVGWVADRWARSDVGKPLQYAGLGLYVVAEALIFVPLLFVAQWKAAEIAAKQGQDVNIIRDAAYLTLALFGALTASVFFMKKDFSFLRGGLAIGGAAAMLLIVLSIVFGFNLGIVFSVAMVILAAGYVLYYTSQVFAHYRTDQYVAAALALFSAVALMFWYVIRILMKLRE